MPRKVRTNKRRVGGEVTPMQARWLNGEWLLGSEPRTQDETMSALALMAGIGAEDLWKAHGNEETHFWRKGMRSPISLTPDLEHHEASWLESGGEGDKYGGDSLFIHTYYTNEEKQKLWDDFGDKENFKWTKELRRPIPAAADWNAAINTFAGSGLVPYDFPIE
jgi:hypothetical protein